MSWILFFVACALVAGNLLQLHLRRPLRIAPYLAVGALVGMMVATGQQVDLGIYQSAFYWGDRIQVNEVGYAALVQFARSAGLDFVGFRAMFFVLGVILITVGLAPFVRRPTAFFILYALYPYFLDVVQMRNFLAMSIVIVAITRLAQGRRLAIVQYLALVAVAASIQSSAVFYAPLVFLKRAPNRWFLVAGGALVAGGSILALLDPSALSEIVAGWSNADDRIAVYAQVSTRLGFLPIWVLWGAGFGGVLACRRVINAAPADAACGLIGEGRAAFVDLVVRLNGMMAVALPLCLLNVSFGRLFRILAVVNLVVFLMGIDTMERGSSRRRAAWALIVGGYFLAFLQEVYLPFGDSVVWPTLLGNWLLEPL